MTFFTRNRPTRRAGFTLVEMLVVIGIMLTLMAILLPGINAAYKSAVRTRMAADLQVISSALEAYRQDFDQYPQVINPGRGADTLFTALIGPNGTGFQVRPNGKRWGPYLPPDRFKNNGAWILDRNSAPIFYFPAKRSSGVYIYATGNSNPNVGYIGTSSGGEFMFNGNDNSGYSDASNQPYWQPNQFNFLMGDIGSGSGGATPNGKIDVGETPAFTGNYVLWSCGPDGKCGPPNVGQPVSPSNRCDDVANFPRSEY